MKKRNKIFASIVILIAIFFIAQLGIKISKGPHTMSTGEVLQNFTWTLKSKTTNSSLGTVNFAKHTITIKSGNKTSKSSYTVNSDDDLKINSGNYAGTYSLDMDSTDYSLSPENSGKSKLELVRN